MNEEDPKLKEPIRPGNEVDKEISGGFSRLHGEGLDYVKSLEQLKRRREAWALTVKQQKAKKNPWW